MERSKEFDVVERPKHYNSHPSGLEAIDICEHLTFNLGNAVKYLWRAGLKNDETEDLKKALWYIKRERELEKVYDEAEQMVSPQDGRSRAMTWLIVRVLMRKVIAAEPESVLGTMFRSEDLGSWEQIVMQAIERAKVGLPR